MPTYRLDIAYDGTDFHGYARQPRVRTVQGVLEEALATALGPVETAVAGRTDAGVHAARQVVSFATDEEISPERLERSLRRLLPEDVTVLSCRRVPDRFHARFSAVSRSYRYTVLNSPAPDPLLRRTAWHVPDPLALEEMSAAAGHLVGTHDFASLCRAARGRSRGWTIRTVLAARWRRPRAKLLVFDVRAESFCHQMVRSMVALCVEIGRGKLPAQAVPAILEARDRNAARGAAPARGLVLWRVSYH